MAEQKTFAQTVMADDTQQQDTETVETSMTEQ
jgi:hypothetical protein